MRLDQRVVMITGAGRGLGRVLALQAAEQGADIALLGPAPDELDRVASQIVALGRRAVPLVADVTDRRAVHRACDSAHHNLAAVDVLVNNASIIGPTSPAWELTPEDWDRVLQVNLTGALHCIQAVLPPMMQRRRGKIVNIASMAGKQAYPLRAPYAVSKWGLVGLTMTLAKELGPYQIEVNAVCPGPIEGERMGEVIARRAAQLGCSEDRVRDEYLGKSAMGRMVRYQEVAATVLFLASSQADGVTGQAIDVSAGYGL